MSHGCVIHDSNNKENGEFEIVRPWSIWMQMIIQRNDIVVEIVTARSSIVYYLRGPQGQYVWKCKYSWMPSARIRDNSHLWPYWTSPSPAIRDTTTLAINDISDGAILIICAPAIQDSSPAESYIFNTPPSCDALWSMKKTNKQTNKHDAQRVIPIEAS
jgi:hypothetical protein